MTVDGDSEARARWTPISVGVMTFVVAISVCVVGYWIWLIARGPESQGESMYQTQPSAVETNAVEGPSLD